MNHSNDFMDSSALDLMDLDVVIEEGDFVFVTNDGNPGEDWDATSYDLCDLSSALSCATSVATNLTLRDLHLIDEDPPAAAMDIETNEDGTSMAFLPMANPKNGLRLSKKKQRKLRRKMKMTQKAAAAKAAAVAHHRAGATCAAPSSPWGAPPPSPKRKAAPHVAVACARESLEARKAPKKTRPVDPVA